MRVGRTAGTWLLAAALCLAAGQPARAADGEAILKGSCAGCHDLTGPAPTTVQGIRARQGPDLFYAGNKYRSDWLEAWLQAPTRIRPAGMFYGAHIRATDQWDQVDPSTLKPHPRLSAAEAKAVADALMKRKAGSDRLEGVQVKKVSVSIMMGDLMFEKFKGCIACHQSGPDYGGFSGPELYTAARRLTPAFMYSYMKNPQAWDPRIWMPNMGLTDTDLNKLVRYLELVAQESQEEGG